MEVPYRGSGKVFYKEKEYKCDLYYSEDLGGVVLNINHMKTLASFLELPVEMKCLSGQLENGFKFMLYKCHRTKTMDMISYEKTVYTYEAEYLFCGVGGYEQNALSFYKAEYTLSDIVEWGEVSTYRVGENYELSKLETPERTIFEDDEVKITYKVYGNELPVVETQLLKEKIELHQQGVIEIQSTKETALDDFNFLFQKIKRLIEISSLRKMNLEKMELYADDVFEVYGEHKIHRPIPVYGSTIKKYDRSEMQSSSRRYAWISLSELMQNDSFHIYFEKYEKLEPIIELFIESLYIKSSSRRTFLNIVQALETYHSRFITNDLTEYKKRVESISKNMAAGMEEKIKKYLTANSRKFITLESRLADLLFAENKIYFETGDIRKMDFPEVIAKTRNYYIHYDEKIKEKHRVLSMEELGIYNGTLLYMLEYYILKELGFQTESGELRDKLNTRWGSISQQLQIYKLSQNIDK